MYLKLQMLMNKATKPSQRASILGAVLLTVSILLGACTKKVDDKDNTLTIPLKAQVKGLDPMHSQDLYQNQVIGSIYEGLFQYSYLKRPATLEPAIAEAMPTVSDNGLTHTFKIKKGVRFQDNAAFPGGKGRELTAEDFIYSFKRLADPKNLSEGWWIFDGKIKGLNEWAEAMKSGKANYDTPLEGLQAPDKHTLVIKLKEPYYQLYDVLAMPYASAVAREAVEKYAGEIVNNPVGTGPYLLEKPADWIRGSKITLKKNPTWRGEAYPSEGMPGDKEAGLLEDAGKALPFSDTLIFVEIPEDQPRWQNLAKGNFDFGEISNDSYDTAVKDKKLSPEFTGKGARLDIAPEADTVFDSFNMNDPLLGKNKELRRAMMLAMDRTLFAEKFYNGRALVAESPIAPGIAGYDEKYKSPYEFNLEKAKEALKKAGYPDGKGLPALSYHTRSSAKERQMGEFVAQQMAAIGIKVNVITSTWPQFTDKLKKGQAQMWGMAWGADYPDAQNFLQLFYSKNVSPGPNDSNFKNAEFDRLYEQSMKLPPGKERDALYAKMRDIVMEEVPWIPKAHRVKYHLVHGWLHNLKWNDISHTFPKYLRVDPKKRAELKPKL